MSGRFGRLAMDAITGKYRGFDLEHDPKAKTNQINVSRNGKFLASFASLELAKKAIDTFPNSGNEKET